MKRFLKLLAFIFFLLLLNGCTDINKDSFSYYDGYQDDNKKYFDKYALIYDNNDLNIFLYAVKSKEILDNSNQQYINYILKWDVKKVEDIKLTCGNYILYSEKTNNNDGKNKYYLISGEEISDNCQDILYFELSVNDNDLKENIKIFKSGNDDLNWENVSKIKDRSLVIFIRQNIELFIYIGLIIVLTIILIFCYRVIYTRNLNNYVKGKKIYKLPDLHHMILILIGISLISVLVLIGLYDTKSDIYDNNFYNYKVKEQSREYLPEINVEDYELLSANDRQAIYVEKIGKDKIFFYYILLEQEKKYPMDKIGFSIPFVLDKYDTFQIDFYEKATKDNGLLIGYIMQSFRIENGEKVLSYSIYNCETKKLDGKLKFIDFYEDYIYYKNAKGYYRIYTKN